MHSPRRVAIVAFMSLAMPAGLTTSAAMASTSTPVPEPSNVQTFRAAKFICKAKADRPHWSKGAKSVIYKTRVECAGSVPSVKVHCKGQLIYSVGGGPSTAATSSETQIVKTDGTKATFYTPEKGGKKVDWSGNFQGSSRCDSPGSDIHIGDAHSEVVTVKVP